jgi:hypothetical protein
MVLTKHDDIPSKYESGSKRSAIMGIFRFQHDMINFSERCAPIQEHATVSSHS